MSCMWPMRRCFRWPIYEMYVGGLWQNRVVSGCEKRGALPPISRMLVAACQSLGATLCLDI